MINNCNINNNDAWMFTGQAHQFRAIGLGQRPFLDPSPFTSHLRDFETYRRSKSEGPPTSSAGNAAFKVPGQTTPLQGNEYAFI